MPPIFYPTLPEFQFGKDQYARPVSRPNGTDWANSLQVRQGVAAQHRSVATQAAANVSSAVDANTQGLKKGLNLISGSKTPPADGQKAEYSDGESVTPHDAHNLSEKAHALTKAANSTTDYGASDIHKLAVSAHKKAAKAHIQAGKKTSMGQAAFHTEMASHHHSLSELHASS